MQNIDPGFTFALGILVMLTLALVVALTFAGILLSWALKHLRGFDELGASREDGKVKLGGTLVDLARPRGARKREAKETKLGNGRATERQRLS